MGHQRCEHVPTFLIELLLLVCGQRVPLGVLRDLAANLE
mgnify:CR=1 FL=1